MWIPGLVSVTYRQLTPEEMIPLAKDAGLEAIEWGGDVHVPVVPIENPNKTLTAPRGRAVAVGAMTRGAGLRALSYGTYYRAGQYADVNAEFGGWLLNSCAMSAFTLRLWAGAKSSADTTEDERRKITEELTECAKKAKVFGRKIALEYHAGTLTDNADSARRLIEEIARPNASLYWQPNRYLTYEENLRELETVLPYVSNVHVFAWDADKRLPLAEHERNWHGYLNLLAKDCRRHALLLEFVPNDDPAVLKREADTLLSWIRRG